MTSQSFMVMCSVAVPMWLLQACTTDLPTVPEAGTIQSNVAVGRVVVALTGERSRIYQPALRSFEIENRQTKERFTVEIESDNERFILPLTPGDYELTRVQINEGPFLSMAQLNSNFTVGQEPILYLGTWRFGVDSPKYGRMVSISMVSDEEDRAQAAQSLGLIYPSLDGADMATAIPAPAELQTRLFEVMPYPRVPRYFRRHWW
ncbi:MAG TPA: hypothetical protein VF732_00425 [Nitrospira sp.]